MGEDQKIQKQQRADMQVKGMNGKVAKTLNQKGPASWLGRNCNSRNDNWMGISQANIHGNDVCIGLLIRANCMKAFKPIQVIASESGGLYAYRTRLGWCIGGPIMNGDINSSISCHQVTVTDAST